MTNSGANEQGVKQGHDTAQYPSFAHDKLVNRGWYTIFAGGRYDSYLMLLKTNGVSMILLQKL
jgi:hypothetical protein